MDAEPRHIIKRQLLEIQGLSEQAAAGIQQRLLPMFYQQIVPLLDQYCTQLSPNERPFRIDRLELDLGTLPADRLEQAFLEAISQQLRTYFEPLIQVQAQSEADTESDGTSPEQGGEEFLSSQEQSFTQRAPEAVQSVSPTERALQLLRQVVETGSLPWWADAYPEAGQDPLFEALSEVLSESSSRQQFVSLLHRWSRQPARLARLLRLYRFPLWGEVAALGMDLSAEELTELIADLSQGLNLLEPAPISLRQTHEQFGQLLLQLLFQSPGRKTQGVALWEAFLKRWANERAMPFGELVVQLYSFAQSTSTTSPSKGVPDKLLSLLKQLQSTSALLDSSPFQKQVAELRQRIRTLLQQLQSTPTLFDAFSFREQLTELKQRIRALRWIPEMPAEIKGRLLSFLQQVEAGLREAPSVTNDDFVLQLSQWEAELTSLEQGGLAHQSTALDTASSQMGDMAEETSEIPLETDDFSETEELFVGNAGLVILWPYLVRFFENLGLVEEKAFVNEAAQHRAVGLLQFLVDGQSEPAEYRCGLNKILCGLDWDAVLDFGEAVSEIEIEACEAFLQAVITNAPILGDMSLDGFRGSFLLRKGIIRSGPGSWQLQVERQAYDIVLEKFPWNWAVVKLPWMRWAVGVEW